MQKNTYKKILISTFLAIFLFGIFLPLGQSLAQEPSGLKIEAEKYTVENNTYVKITAQISDSQIVKTMDKAIINFSSNPEVKGFNDKAKCEAKLNAGWSCFVSFRSSASKQERYEISASITEPKTIKSNLIKIVVCAPGQTLDKAFCIGDPTTTTPPNIISPETPKEESKASTNTTYTPLEKLPGLEGTFDTKPSETNKCPFGNYLNIMIKLIIGFAAVLAMIMIVMGGIEYMTSELVSGKESGKETVTNAILGLLIALGAYMILNTINPALLDACLDKLPEAKIIIDDSVPQTPINGMYCTKTAGTNGGYKAGADWKTIAGEAKALPSGVNTNNGECMKVGDSNCTSLRGLDLSIINNIKNKCGSGCEIIVTAGTECWLHGGKSQNTTHRPNSPTIDVRATLSANTFFTGNTSFPNDNKPYNKGGISCVAEPANATSSTTGSHWHCQ